MDTSDLLYASVREYPQELTPRLVLADYWEEQGREDVASLWRGTVPYRENTRERIDTLTDAERAAMPGWVEKWTRIGLSTQPADRPLFAAATTQCYAAVRLPPPRIQWCPNPLEVIRMGVRGIGVQSLHVRDRILDAVKGRIHHLWFDELLSPPVKNGVLSGVDLVVANNQVHDQPDPTELVCGVGAVAASVASAVRDATEDNPDWCRYVGGQFWASDEWYGGSSYSSFILEVMGLKIPKRAARSIRAYIYTTMSACWWYPLRDVVFVSERPHLIEFQLGKPPRIQWEGWGIG